MAGDAWPSSVRGLSCSLKWGNERNPHRVLQVSHETAYHQVRKNLEIAITNFEITNKLQYQNSKYQTIVLSLENWNLKFV